MYMCLCVCVSFVFSLNHQLHFNSISYFDIKYYGVVILYTILIYSKKQKQKKLSFFLIVGVK